jgi:recombination protein RecA
MDFLKGFKKDLESIDGVGTSSEPPRYWYSFGNFVLNKIMSGSFYKGVPQGRLTSLAGASGAGKSFLAANLVKAAQQSGAYCVVIDSEGALDDGFMNKIGVNTDEDYMYVSVSTVPQVTKVISSFLKGYKNAEGTGEDAQQVFILIDSLDMLMTETEQDHYNKGDQKGDQGQRNKQLKAMLRTFVQDIKKLNVAIVFTSQVYKNQDVMNGEGLWIVSDAVKYSTSQIVLLSKLKLKDENGKAGDFAGIRMKCEGYKTRFSQPFQKVTIEVPYETGMDPTSGLLEVALELGVIEKKGSRYSLKGSDDTWYSKDLNKYAEDILVKCEIAGQDFRLGGNSPAEELDTDTDKTSMAQKRKNKATAVD